MGDPLDVDRIFSMFANEENKIPAELVTRSMRCAGIVVDNNYAGEALDLPSYRKLVEEALASQITRESVEKAFEAMDPQETGYIRASDLKNVLSSCSSPFSQADIRDLFGRFPPNYEGMVCYNLFLHEFYEK